MSAFKGIVLNLIERLNMIPIIHLAFETGLQKMINKPWSGMIVAQAATAYASVTDLSSNRVLHTMLIEIVEI